MRPSMGIEIDEINFHVMRTFQNTSTPSSPYIRLFKRRQVFSIRCDLQIMLVALKVL